jgi:hypothetical protein
MGIYSSTGWQQTASLASLGWPGVRRYVQVSNIRLMCADIHARPGTNWRSCPTHGRPYLSEHSLAHLVDLAGAYLTC